LPSFLNPPPVLGLGQGAGYSLFVEDRAGAGYGALQQAANALQGVVVKTPGMGFPFVGYQSNVPQLDIQVDRVKAKAQGVALTNLFETLQVYLGSSYVNDFNLFGRTWRVYAQADGDFRKRVEDIANLKTRNDKGEMVPIGSMVKISQTYGPDPVFALQRLSGGRLHRRGQSSHAVLGAGDGHDGRACQAGAANGMTIEMDRPQLPGGHPGQRRPAGVPGLGFCLPSWCWRRFMRSWVLRSRSS